MPLSVSPQTKIINVGGLNFEPYISAQEIQDKIVEIAHPINLNYQHKRPLFLVILNGAFVFAADLVRHFLYDCDIAFIRIKSYHDTESTGNVEIFFPEMTDFEDRHIIIVEDIVDTGNTMHAFLPVLQEKKPASIAITALLIKPEAHLHQIEIEYKGFIIPMKFVLGYGLDYNGLGRNLKDLYQLCK